MKKQTVSIVRLLVIGLLVAALAGLAVAGCGDEETTTTAAPATETTAAPTDTTAGAAEGTSGAVAVKGMADNPMTLTVAELENLGTETLTVEHPKKGEVEYTGVRFGTVLDALKVAPGATAVVMIASDGYAAEVPLADIETSTDALLVIEDGMISSVFPGLETKAWVKDIVSMEFK
jgi:hypothetical protein